MALISRNDEQIKVGLTIGLTAGSSSFVFDGTSGKLDYRYYDLVVSEISGRGILVKGLDFSWNSVTGTFTLLQSGDLFQNNQFYNIHFEPLAGSTPSVSGIIIDYTYFIRNINIPNIAPTPNNPILERLNSFIEKYEPECLLNILGYELYKLLLTESSQRMLDIIYGAEYFDEVGDLRKWNGLVYDPKISLIANYIYYFFQEASATQTTGVATSVSKTESAVSVSPADKMINAWNFFSSETKSLIIFLWMKKDGSDKRVYPEFSSSQYFKTVDFSRHNNIFGI